MSLGSPSASIRRAPIIRTTRFLCNFAVQCRAKRLYTREKVGRLNTASAMWPIRQTSGQRNTVFQVNTGAWTIPLSCCGFWTQGCLSCIHHLSPGCSSCSNSAAAVSVRRGPAARRFHTFDFCWQFSRIVLLQTIKHQICAKYWNRIDEIHLILKGFQVDLFVWTSNVSPSHLRSTFYFTLKYCGRCVHLSPSSSCDMIKIVNTKQHDSVPGCWVARQGSNLALLTACILYSALSSQGVYRGGGR